MKPMILIMITNSQSNPIQHNQTRPIFQYQIPISIRISNCMHVSNTQLLKIRIYMIKPKQNPSVINHKRGRILNNWTQIASQKIPAEIKERKPKSNRETWFTHLLDKDLLGKTENSIFTIFQGKNRIYGKCVRDLGELELRIEQNNSVLFNI